ncbi:hypothetical protein [Vreelandella sp. TE19]
MLFKILIETYSTLLSYKRITLIALIGPLGLTLIAALLTQGLVILQPRPVALYLSLELLAEAIDIAAYTLLVVVVCNAILRQQTSGFGRGLFWGQRETRLFLYQLGLYALFIPVSLFAFVPVAGVWISLLLSGYLYSRLALVLPGIAVGQPLTFRLAWQLSRPYQWSAFVVLALFPTVIGVALESLPSAGALSLLRALLFFATSLISVTAMAILYREIVTSAAQDAEPLP